MDKSALIKSIGDWREYYLAQLTTSFKREIDLILPSNNIALGLIGIRRSGKTTLAIQLSQKIGSKKTFYYNFEDPLFNTKSTTSDIDLLLETAEEIADEKIELLILDEIHNVDQWEKWLRKLIDLKRYRIIVTGSSAKLIRSELSSSLTGRVIAKEIWPLSLFEYQSFSNKLKRNIGIHRLCKEYLTYGGFPAVSIEDNLSQKKELLHSYFTDILMKDVVSRNKIRNVKLLRDLATYIVTNLSSHHSSVSIEKALGIDKETAIQYLGFLADAFLINACELHTNNLKIQKRASTKYYLTDIGIRLVGARTSNPDDGKLLENLVYLELRRNNPSIFYFKAEQEVDFLVCDKYRPEAAYQVAYTIKEEKTRQREINALLELSKNYNLKNLFIITWNEAELIKIAGLKISVIPVSKFCRVIPLIT